MIKIMKKETYSLRRVTDGYDTVLYYEFVRNEDEIIRTSESYDLLYAFAEGYTLALNKAIILE